MSKSIYDEALEIIDKNTFELGKGLDVMKPTYRETVVKALKLGKLYKTLCEEWQSILREFQDDIFINDELIDKLQKLVLEIKELENE